MTTVTVELQPGVNLELTPSLNQTQWQATNLIRFAPSGLPQKLGGWTKFYPASIGSIVRELHAWENLSGQNCLAIGAQGSLDVIVGGVFSNITPLIQTDNVAVNVSTVNTSAVVTIIDAGIATNTNDVVIIETPISIGGIVLLGAYAISTVVSSSSYQIVAASSATATVNNAGAVPSFTSTLNSPVFTVTLNNHGYSVGSTFPVFVATTVGAVVLSGFYTVTGVTNANVFLITAAYAANANQTVSMNGGNAQYVYYTTPAQQTFGTGYGVGGYGSGGYGSGQSVNPTVGTPIVTTDWSLDNFGGYFVGCPLNGPVFLWNPQGGLQNATPIPQAPVINAGLFVAMPEQIIVAYGSSVLGVQDPLLINWCDAGQYTSWTATVTNQAGEFRIPRGSKIVGGMQGPLQGLIWTDLSIWAMAYIGSPYVFSFNEIASGCGLIGKHAAVTLGGTVYWMSQKQFFALPSGGSVTPIPCGVWDFVFQNLDTANVAKIRAAANSQFGEVTWYFPVAGGSGENTAYVKYTAAFNCWDYGFLGRSAWIDQSVFGAPIGADPVTQYIYQHETSPDADGAAMNPVATTGYFAFSEGQNIGTCNSVYPDMVFKSYGASTSAAVQIQFNYTNYATENGFQTPVYTMRSNTPNFLNPRFRGRLMQMTVSSSDLGSFWRFGALRMRVAPDGRL